MKYSLCIGIIHVDDEIYYCSWICSEELVKAGYYFATANTVVRGELWTATSVSLVDREDEILEQVLVMFTCVSERCSMSQAQTCVNNNWRENDSLRQIYSTHNAAVRRASTWDEQPTQTTVVKEGVQSGLFKVKLFGLSYANIMLHLWGLEQATIVCRLKEADVNILLNLLRRDYYCGQCIVVEDESFFMWNVNDLQRKLFQLNIQMKSQRFIRMSAKEFTL